MNRFATLQGLRQWCIVVIALLACVAMPRAAFAAQPTTRQAPQIKMHRIRAGTPDERGWYFAKSTDGDYSVSLPIPFNDFTMTGKEADGRQVVAYMVGARDSSNVAFTVMRASKGSAMPGFDPKKMAASFRAKAEKISDEREFDWQGRKAFEFRTARTDQVAFIRVVTYPSCFVMMLVEYPPDLADSVTPLIGPFLESLKVDEK